MIDDRANEIDTRQASPKSIRVFSKRKNEYVEVSLSAENAIEDQLGGVMPVMLVTDHPLSN